MTNLTDKQIKLLLSNKEDLKAIMKVYLLHNHDSCIDTFDSFASQFTVEPEWKILSYNCCQCITPSERVIDKKSYPIHSVQYKSETLTIGDETDKGKITKFELKEGLLYVWCNNGKGETWFNIELVKKIERKVRFVTNGDGEEIFEGDKYHYIWTDKFPMKIMNRLADGNKYEGNESHTTYFKSKEKATEYVLLNSPKLSVAEVQKVCIKLGVRDYFFDKLIELVKSKQ